MRNTHERKKALRAKIRARRRALSPAIRQARDAKIQQHILAELHAVGARSVAAFSPLPYEPGGGNLAEVLAGEGFRLLLPRVVLAHGTSGRFLEFCEYDGHLQRSAWGIAEPMGPADPHFPQTVDIILLPALAISTSGRRLGQGGGFYDRAVKEMVNKQERDEPLDRPALWAIIDNDEFVHEVPTDQWDLRVDYAITEYGGTSLAL